MKRLWIPLMVCVLGFGIASMGCSEGPVERDAEEPVASASVSEGSVLSRDTTLGPVHAVVSLSDSNPVLGTLVTLTLTVDALSDVVVTMPEFGDQLGKFGIVDFKPSERVREDGRTEYVQRYSLDLPMSGRLRTPSFLVEFTDRREGSESGGGIQELMTEEMSFEVRSVFADGEVPGELAPARGALEALVIPETGGRSWGWFVAGFVALVAGMVCVVAWRRRRAPKAAPPADVVALGALDALEKRGIPSDWAGIDAWYVELSGIVRAYVEGRFDVCAPRLTTEEFFELARRSDVLGDEEKHLIHKLLERADRVKFTHFVPEPEETSQMLADARRFVEETRGSVVEKGESDA